MPKPSQATRFVFSALASAILLTALFLPAVNLAAGQLLTSITVTPTLPTLEPGQTQQFTATGTYDDGSSKTLTGGGGTWAAAGSLAAARFYHTATLLQDGSVLVAGGYNGGTLATAQRYFPSTNTWSSAGTMGFPRAAHTATLLPNGKVLVVGGINFSTNAVTDTTELYDPATNSWSAGPNLSIGIRAFHSAVLLNTGKVLVVAGVMGWPDCTYRATAELYTPGTPGSWTQTGSLHLARSNANTVLLASGQMLLAGGPANNCPTPNVGMNQAEIYNPVTGGWTVTGNTTVNRYNNFIAALPNGNALLAGGVSNNVTQTYRATTEVYSAAAGTFSDSGSMATARATSGGTGDNGTTVVLQNGDVLVAGGSANGGGVLSSAELYATTTGLWTPTGSMFTARNNNTATLLQDGRVLAVGGHNASGVALPSAEIYTPQVSWSSSNPAVVTVAQTGLVTAVGTGTTSITASSGGVSGHTTLTVEQDTVPPSTMALYPSPNVLDWYKADVTVNLTSNDQGGSVTPSGVQSLIYSLSGAQSGGGTVGDGSSSATAMLTITNEGTTTVTYHAVDNKGNVEPDQTLTIKLDKTPPTLSGLSNITTNATSPLGAVLTFSPTTFDALSGVDTVGFTQGLTSGSTFLHGTTTEEVTVTDTAGNRTSQTFTVTVNKTLTSIAVTPSAATIAGGQTNQQFTATGTYTDLSMGVLGGSGGTWVPTGSLATPRIYHTATRLQDGSVLVVGGYNAAATVFASAERYYPATHTWASAGSMTMSRLGHSATLLPNGKVLVVGGRQNPASNQTNTTEIYDPATNSWSAGPPLLLGVREAHSAVLLNTNKVLVVAGLQNYPDCTYRANAELYDPATDSWAITGSLHLARSSATATLLSNGKVLLAGGPQNNCPTPNVGMSQAEVYDPATGTWSVTGSLSVPRYANAIAVLPNGKVLLAGGNSTAGTVASADLYDPAPGTFSLTTSMGTARQTSVGTGDNGAMPVLFSGQVLIAGGHAFNGTFLASSELYDPISHSWIPTGSLNTARTYHTETLLQDGTVLAVGGMGTGSVTLGSAEVYTPPSVLWTSTNAGVATITQNGLATGNADGTATITATAGPISGTAALTVDKTAPTTTATPSAAPNAAGWNNTHVELVLSATDAPGGTSVQSITYSYNGGQNGGPFTTPGSSTSFTIGSQGTTTVNYHATDNGGNSEPDHALMLKIDSVGPNLSYPFQVTTTATSSAGAVVNFNVSAFDTLSGVSGPVTVSPLASGNTFPTGTTRETVTATDVAGNTSTAFFDVIVSPGDTVAPTTNANYPAPNANGWNRFNVNVNLNAFDSDGPAPLSGVQSITYSVSGAQTGGGTVNGSSTSIFVSTEGTTTITYYARDNAGNVEAERALTIRLDKTQPALTTQNITATATSSAGAVVNFVLAPTDSLSGVDIVTVTPLASGATFPHGNTNEQVTVTDRAGNSIFRNFNVTVNKGLQSISVSPLEESMRAGSDRQFQAFGHFTDGSATPLPSSGGGSGGGGGGGGGSTPSNSLWQVNFTPGFDVSPCTSTPTSFSSQAVSANLSGMIDGNWGNGNTVHVTGTLTPAAIDLTVQCNPANGGTGSVSATWTGTRYEGTATLNSATTTAVFTGWSSKAPLPSARFSFSAATVNGIVYAMGGGNPSQSQPVDAYNPATNSWTTVSTMPVPVEGAAVAALNGIIYVAGGHVAGGNSSNILQSYDPATNTWAALSPMQAARASLALVAADGKLYAIGGQAGSGSGPATAVVERYDPGTDTWSPRASMATPRRFVVAGALNNDTMIVAAGAEGSSVELYDVAANTWAPGPAMLSSGGSPAAVVVSNALHVFGVGNNGTGVYLFRPASELQPGGWAVLASLPTGRGQLAVAAVNDVVYATGGLLPGGGSTTTAVTDAFSVAPPGNFAVSSGGGGSGGSGGGSGGGSLPVVAWQSTDTSVATIDSSGRATGLNAGLTTIVVTAAGISCVTTGTCATLTVTPAAKITFTLAPGSVPQTQVSVSVVDPSTGEVVDGPFDVPIGETQQVPPEQAFRLVFGVPAGLAVTPPFVDLYLAETDDIAIPLLFEPDDTTPPTVTCGTADGLWHGTDVTIACTASDAFGLEDPSDASFSLTTSVADGTETANALTNSRAICDQHGNCTTAGPIAGNMVDKKAPSITISVENVVVEATSSTGGVIAYPAMSFTDDGSGIAYGTCTPDGTHFPLGSTTVECTVFDSVGNASAPDTFVVNVVDTTPPAVTCAAPDGLWHNTDASIACTASDAVGLENPADATFSLTTSVAAGTETANAVTNSRAICDKHGHCVTAGPIAGNKVDKKAPALTVSANQTAEATGPGGANVGFAPATATDPGSGLLSVSCNRLPGSLFPPGATTVQCTAGDIAGNASSASFVVTVVDTTRPVLTVPGNLIVEAQFAQGAYVVFPVSAIDSVDGARPVTCSQPSGSLFRFGVSGVFCTASDTRGNTASGSFSVTVRDATPPALQIFSPKPEDPVMPGGTATVLVDVTEATQTRQVTVNGINAYPIAQTAQITLRWQATVPVPPGGPLAILVSATDVFGNNRTAFQTLTDNDGIESAIDRNRITGANESLVFSSGFNFNGTVGTVTRNGTTLASVTRGAGATVRIGLPAGGGARVNLCTGADKYVDVGGGPNAGVEVTCGPSGTVSVQNVGGSYAFLYKQTVGTYYTTTTTCYTTGGWFNRRTYCYQVPVPHTYTYYYQIALAPGQGASTGSPIVAGQANTEPLQVTLLQVDDDGTQNAVADLSVDAGESVDVAVQPGAGRQDLIQIFALAGDVTVAIGATTQTISQGAEPVLPVTVIPTVPRKKAPKVKVPGNMKVVATSPAGAVVTFSATATDPVDGALSVTCSPPSGSVFPIGETTVSCTATSLGGKSDTGTFTVTVRDTTPPDLVSVTPSLTVLPDTDETVAVTLAVVVTDIADTFPVCRITKVRGQGKDLDQDSVIDWQITGDLALNIEANARKHRDRTYSITVKCSDDSQNVSKEKTTIVVSHAH